MALLTKMDFKENKYLYKNKSYIINELINENNDKTIFLSIFSKNLDDYSLFIKWLFNKGYNLYIFNEASVNKTYKVSKIINSYLDNLNKKIIYIAYGLSAFNFSLIAANPHISKSILISPTFSYIKRKRGLLNKLLRFKVNDLFGLFTPLFNLKNHYLSKKINTNSLIMWSDNDKQFNNDKFARKIFFRNKKNKSLRFIGYPNYGFNIYKDLMNEGIDHNFEEDLFDYINDKPNKPILAIMAENHLPFFNGVNMLSDLMQKELTNLGYRVYIVTIRLKGVDYQKLSLRNIILFKGIHLPGKKAESEKLYLTFFPRIKARKLRIYNFDTILLQSEFSVSKIGMRLAKKLNVPLIYTNHTLWDQMFKYRFDRFVLFFVKLTTHLLFFSTPPKKCDLMTVPSYKTLNLWNKKGKKDNIVIIPGVINLNNFILNDNDLIQIKEIKDKYDLNGYKLFGFIGRLGKEKHLDELINYFDKAADKYNNIKFIIIGDGSAYDFYYRLAEHCKHKDKFLFLGSKDNKETKLYYHLFDAFMTASNFETQGLTYLEALASDTLIIAKEDPCLDGFLIKDKNAFLYSNFDEWMNYIDIVVNHNKLTVNIIKESKNTLKKYQADYWIEKWIYLFSQAKKLHDGSIKQVVYTNYHDENLK